MIRLSSQPSSRARETRVMVCVTAHYVEARLPWLEQVLTAFDHYFCPVIVLIYTNEIDRAQLAKIKAILPKGLSVRLRVGRQLEHPFDLVWCHKDAILRDFLAKDYTHFIYVEDDIIISFKSFMYWVTHRQALQRKGLVPGFVRVEQVQGKGAWYATDQFSSTNIDWLRTTRVGRWSFTNLDSSYTASFILDQSLAYEHVASTSFTEVSSRTVKPGWGSRERAAMGITFERVPLFYLSRVVVPFDRKTLQVPDCAKVVHAPGNYAEDQTSDLAKLPVTNLLQRQPLSGQVTSIAGRVGRKIFGR